MDATRIGMEVIIIIFVIGFTAFFVTELILQESMSIQDF